MMLALLISHFVRSVARSSTTAQALRSSIAVGDGSVFWLSVENIVYRSRGYRPVRISTHAIETIINHLGPILASAFTVTERGHVIYVMNYPTRTLAYDCATELWHERASSADGAGRWRCNAVPTVPISGIVGDYNSGNLYRTAPSATVLDHDVRVRRIATSGPRGAAPAAHSAAALRWRWIWLTLIRR